jgi:apolipoprotein N-acyltransferase
MAMLHVILFVILQSQSPGERLSFLPAELVYLPCALGFLFLKIVRKRWRHWLGTVVGIQALFVVVYYNVQGGTLSLVSFFLFLLLAFFWGLYELVRWSIFHSKQSLCLRALAWSILAWSLYALAVPPLPLGPFAVIILAPWIYILWNAPLGRVLFATFWSGIVYHAISYFWIFNVAKVGPAPAVIGGLFLLISYFSMFHVIGAWIFVSLRRYSVRGISLVWLFPFAWAGIEVLRSYGQISFPWGHLGYVFGNHVELVQGLAWVGVYGYSILVLYTNMGVIRLWGRHRTLALLIPVITIALLWTEGTLVIRTADRRLAENPQHESMNIALVQPSILQTKKWSPEYYDSVMAKTWSLLDTMQTDGLNLIVLPETAIPDFISLRPRESSKFRKFVASHRVNLLTGALDFDRNGPPPRRFSYFNSSFLFDTNGTRTPFRKTRLVPFSEYLPFNGLIPVINYVDLGEGDFSPGDTLPMYGKENWTPNICYESIYPDILRRMVRNGTRIVVNITNDGWFGKTTAPGQHANLIRYRAIESAMPVARCANSGISIFYDAQGRSFERTQLFDELVVSHKLPLRNHVTFYTNWGDAWEDFLSLAFSAIALALILAYLIRNRFPRR